MASPIPRFTEDGLLPPGDYEATFAEMRASPLVTGPGPDNPFHEGWDAQWREHLTRQAETMCEQLWRVGIENVFLDGSFVEAKGHPNDIDGYFTDERGIPLTFPSAFRQRRRDGSPKGIVKVVPQ